MKRIAICSAIAAIALAALPGCKTITDGKDYPYFGVGDQHKRFVPKELREDEVEDYH